MIRHKQEKSTPVLTQSANVAKTLIDYLVSEGLPLSHACERAGQLLSPQSHARQTHLGTMSQSDYSIDPTRKTMATAVKERSAKKVNGHSAKAGKTDEKLPSGSDFCERFARGLIRWRAQKGLSKKQAIERYHINRSAWYRVEQAVSNGLTATHIDTICRAIGVKDTDILTLGERE